jgi:3',5'-cyclic AMP phosphodiesterase CpdA
MGLLRQMLTVVLGALLCAGLPSAAQAERIVAIGDLHGDYAAFTEILEAAGIADDKGRWTGGDATLVQTGDVTDRGADSLKIIHLLEKLEDAAPKKGGRVVALLGNHEAMNITGDLRYVDPGEFAAFRTSTSDALRDRVFEATKDSIVAYYRQWDATLAESAAKQKWLADNPVGKMEHRVAWQPSGEVGKWYAEKPAIVKIGDTLFVHGGISVETAARPFADVNAEIRSELAKGESFASSILNDELGPLWYRGNVQRDPPGESIAGEPPPPERISIADELTQVLAAYGAKRLVVAHTPHLPGIVATEGGRLVRIDTGISAYYGGVHSYLELEDGRATAWRKDQGGKWISEELPSP